MTTDLSLAIRHKRIFVPIIIALNILVFVMWHFRIGLSAHKMEYYFLASQESLLAGDFICLLGSAFSHIAFFHLFINMLVLSNFGSLLEAVIGSRFFIIFYLAAGIFASLCHCLVSGYILHNPELPVLGASGAISGLVILFSLMFSKEKLLILGVLPIPALFGASIFVGLDIWGLFAQARGGGLPIGHGAHLGGALFGALTYFFYLRPRLSRGP